MLDDVNAFFGDVTPQGVVVLLILGLLTGFGLHDVLVVIWDYAARNRGNWYDRSHDEDDASA